MDRFASYEDARRDGTSRGGPHDDNGGHLSFNLERAVVLGADRRAYDGCFLPEVLMTSGFLVSPADRPRMRMVFGRMMYFEEGLTPVALPLDKGLCRCDGVVRYSLRRCG